ncbi:MAG: D-glycero-beta-D-manno-heptose-7-phosphate kinase [Candidatus Zixiibacteriota bacterium]
MSFDAAKIDNIVSKIGKARVLILGDIMLDEYLFGKVERISPEAPVPVVEINSTRLLLGGAANVAANIRALGDTPLLIGTVGEDDASVKLSQLLKKKKISSELIMNDPTRQTTIKTRIIANSQQVVRADRENRHNLDPAAQKRVLDRFMQTVDSIDAVIISDYGKGVIAPEILEPIISVCNEKNKFIAVDPKDTNFHRYVRVSLITPNHHEAGFAYGHRIINEQDLYTVGNGLLEKLDVRAILITRGAEGMSLFTRDSEPTHIPTFARQVYDVTGAGDTVIAVFVSAICAGANLVEAAVIANAGAGYTVGMVGTATISLEALKNELAHNLKNGNLSSALASADDN